MQQQRGEALHAGGRRLQPLDGDARIVGRRLRPLQPALCRRRLYNARTPGSFSRWLGIVSIVSGFYLVAFRQRCPRRRPPLRLLHPPPAPPVLQNALNAVGAGSCLRSAILDVCSQRWPCCLCALFWRPRGNAGQLMTRILSADCSKTGWASRDSLPAAAVSTNSTPDTDCT